MLRAFSTRRSGYDRLVDESSIGLVEVKLSRSATLPAKLFGSRRKAPPEGNLPPIPEQKPSTAKIPENSGEKQVKKASKILPIFSIFEKRRRKKATAKPEFARYMEYIKEGGTWDDKLNMPVIHYK
ncbi:putative Dihydroflavonol-4-reductase [Heracleum sosnowskyi]|uniref:Dihydroflavonol-4-reductase n=1 Tax=Heracleum sosnowskyi TaxID=360622 RepID=A0AAD8MHZ1_9APIA|nr:putative Dihydroflavonol-4-reductase [Heracleum sosnowskyi]